MRTTSRIPVVILAVLALLAGAAAAEERELTNADVLKMAEAGLADTLLTEAIRTQPGSYDVRPQALIALRDGGVPESVLESMMRKMAGEREQVTIPDGTPLVLRLKHAVSSASARQGEPVLFEVVEPLLVDGFTVVAAGAGGEGTIVEARHRKGFGRRGRLDFTIDAVEAADGQRIPLRTSRSLKGRERYNKAGVITLLFGPFGILVKGEDIEVPGGTEYTIYTDHERTIELGEEGESPGSA